MENKFIPTRMCCVCRTRHPKCELIKVVKTKENKVLLDINHNLGGRGAYICKDKNCLEKLSKTRALNRTFKCEVPLEIYNKIASQIKGEF